jgi:hypothetical protein
LDLEGEKMKKLVILAWMLISATLLMAGGKVSPVLSPVAEIPAKPCKADKVYIEYATDLMWQDQGYTDEEDLFTLEVETFGHLHRHQKESIM